MSKETEELSKPAIPADTKADGPSNIWKEGYSHTSSCLPRESTTARSTAEPAHLDTSQDNLYKDTDNVQRSRSVKGQSNADLIIVQRDDVQFAIEKYLGHTKTKEPQHPNRTEKQNIPGERDLVQTKHDGQSDPGKPPGKHGEKQSEHTDRDLTKTKSNDQSEQSKPAEKADKAQTGDKVTNKDHADKVATTYDITKERGHLAELLDKHHMKPQEKKEFLENMQKLEHRHPEVSPEEAAKTYHEIGRLLEGPSNKLKPQELTNLAEQVMRQAAAPADNVTQGWHETCIIASSEARTYMLYPSIAANMVADIALTGKHELPNGNLIEVDQRHSVNRVHIDPRSHASEIFQSAAITTVYKLTKDKIVVFEEDEEKGQRVEFSSFVHEDVKPGTGGCGDYIIDKNGKKWEYPGMLDSEIAPALRAITGKDEATILGEKSKDTGSTIRETQTEGQFTNELRTLLESGKPPMVSVDDNAQPFFTKMGGTKAGDDLGGTRSRHSVVATGFREGPPAEVQIYNPAAQGKNFETQMWVPVHDVFIANRNPGDELKEIEKDIDKARDSGKIDFAKEFEFARISASPNEHTDPKWLGEMMQAMKKAKDAGTLSGADFENASGELGAAISRFDTMDKLKLCQTAHDQGLISNEIYGWNMVKAGLQIQKLEMTARTGKDNNGQPYSDEIKTTWANNLKTFNESVEKLPEIERKLIQERIRQLSTPEVNA